MANLKQLMEVLPSELRPAEAEKVDKWLDQPLIIHGCRELTGQNGVYARIVVSTELDGDQFIIACGAAQVVDTMMYLKANKLFPVEGTFSKVGRAIIVS